MREGRRLAGSALASALALAACVVVATGPGEPRVEAAPLVVADWDPTPRPLGPITVFGDSVLKGSLETSPSLVDRLAEQGWGPIQARAGGGYSTGEWETGNEQTKATYWIDLWRSQGWDPADVIVNLGANDAGMCQTSACAYRMITYLADHIGPGHRIWWPLITHLGAGRAAAWNAALLRVDAERDDFFTWDWPTEMSTGGYSTGDGVHLGPDSYRKRSRVMAEVVTATLGRASHTGDPAALPAPAGAPSDFLPLPSTRVLDTRMPASAPGGPVGEEQQVSVDVSGVVPPGTSAVAVYVSAAETQGPGYLTAFPCDQARPTASTVNYARSSTRGAVTIVPVVDGRFCLFTKAAAHLLADVQGAFVPVGASTQATRLTPLVSPRRLLDTRATGPVETSAVPLWAGAWGAVINLTAVAHDEAGYLTAYPCGTERPLAAAVNFTPGETVAATAYVPTGDGHICVYAKGGADVVVDVTATLFPAGLSYDGLAFVPVTPTRTLDTRLGTGGWAPVHGPAQTIDATVAPAGARAVSGTLTLASPVSDGYVRAWECGPQPLTSNVNAPAGATFANHVTTGVAEDGRLCLFSLARGTTIFDTTGWWVAPS